MNWHRGLWRMWLVLTLLWISFTTWLTGPIDRFRHLGDPVRFSAENVELEFPGDIEPGKIKTAVPEWIRDQRDGKIKCDLDRLDETPEKMADRIVGQHRARAAGDILSDWATLALLPPVVLLLLGSLVLWALRGFRRDQPTRSSARDTDATWEEIR